VPFAADPEDHVRKSGAEILIDGLIRENVDVMFGYPGGVVIPIFDELYKTGKPRMILVRHEQAAAHAADGYARATGRVGVCLATSGPGATNLVTGIATAYLDSVPMVAITGQVSRALLGTDAFQEADVVGISRPITKHNLLVQRIEDLPSMLHEAFHIASTGRPGPVLIDIPVDISRAFLDNYEYPTEVKLRGYRPNVVGHVRQIKRAAELIKHAEKPLIVAGAGREDLDTGDHVADGPGGVPRVASAVYRHAGDARVEGGQHGVAAGRPDSLDWCAL
jgi:acetolactate synthase-1/2/3 large subunit